MEMQSSISRSQLLTTSTGPRGSKDAVDPLLEFERTLLSILSKYGE